jgi:hypothetical protein
MRAERAPDGGALFVTRLPLPADVPQIQSEETA